MKVVIIQGSSRTDGNTANISERISTLTGWDICHLGEYDINHYDYAHRHENDDFLPLIKALINKYDAFVFATPVYWYSMSGRMKVFFDRLTDLLKTEKSWGRKLRGRKMAVLCSSNSENIDASFWTPFKRTAAYLGMEYLGHMHFYNDESTSSKLEHFTALIKDSFSENTPHPFQPGFLDHVAIRVKDMEASVRWYKQVLGLRKYSFKEWGTYPVFMMAGTSGVALFPEKSSSEDRSLQEKRCVDHFAFNVSMTDLEEAKSHYDALGLEFKEQDHFFFISVYTTDPDGHTVELTALKPGKEYFYDPA